MAAVTPRARTIILTDASTVAFSAALAAYDGTVGPTPTPSFTEDPSMSSDGSPEVGEVSAFSFGMATAPLGAKRLFKDGADYGDASVGSIEWAEAGVYHLRVFIAGTSIYADSPSLTVMAVSVGDVPAPVLSNPDGFVSGTNPPRFRVDIPYANGAGDPFDKSLHKLVIQWDRAANGAFSYDAARSAEITDLMAFANAEDATIAALANQPPGSVFRARTAFVRLSDSVAGAWSNYWIDNLAAAQITPTTFDPDLATGTGLYPATRLSEDKLTAYVGYGGGGNQKAWAIYARGIGARIAYRPNAANGGILLASSTGASPALELALFADGYSALNGQQIGDFGFPVGGEIVIELVANLTTPANIDAMISKGGGTPRRFVLNWPTALFSGVFLGQDEGPSFTITDNTHWGTV